MQITTQHGNSASRLGLAAYEDQDPRCVSAAFDLGFNFFFFYSAGAIHFVEALKPIARNFRNDVIVATGSGARTKTGLRAARRKIHEALAIESIDLFFAEYVHPGDSTSTIFGAGGVLDELQQWKSDGIIRFVGASTHDRPLARRLAEDLRVDVLMHRYNMAHRKAEDEVFPTAIRSHTPVIAFTATRWGTLLAPHSEWSDDFPTAAHCYRFCLAQPAVQIVLTAPKSLEELHESIAVLKSPPMSGDMQRHWKRFGDAVYRHDGGTKNSFESRWP
jgi:aryl-alcohol dehydrogenase-like predicted oxidoreductase